MVKLIRLKGDSDKSETEIRNVFNEGIMLPPNATIGLRACRVNFLNIEDFETYRLPTDTEISLEWFAGNKYQQKVVIPSGDYENTNSLLNAVQKATNSVWIANPANPERLMYQGFHGRWLVESGRTTFQMYSLPNIDAAFAAVNNSWISIGELGSDTGMQRTNGRLVSAGTNTADFELRGQYNTPLVNQTFQCTLTSVITAGSLEINAKSQRAAANDETIPWGFAIEDHNGALRYKLRINNVTHTETNEVPTDGDIMLMRKSGNKCFLSITRGGAPLVQMESGTSPANVTPVPIPLLGDDELTPQLMVWNIKAPTGTSAFRLDDVKYQGIDNMGGTAGNTIQLTCSLPRSNPLGTFLGFTDTTYTAVGAPAAIQGDQPPIGRSTYPGIMVKLAVPQGDLDSYAGQQDSPNQGISYLDVIIPQTIENVNNMIYEPNNIARLALRNRDPIEVKNMNVQFARDDNGQPLRFTGQPMVLLEVD
jgi:hypothetical protein